MSKTSKRAKKILKQYQIENDRSYPKSVTEHCSKSYKSLAERTSYIGYIRLMYHSGMKSSRLSFYCKLPAASRQQLRIIQPRND